jgi:hypothetical protein
VRPAGHWCRGVLQGVCVCLCLCRLETSDSGTAGPDAERCSTEKQLLLFRVRCATNYMGQSSREAEGLSFDILPTECVDVFLGTLGINSGYFLHTQY